jgi:methyl-accepting chemotaxis protein
MNLLAQSKIYQQTLILLLSSTLLPAAIIGTYGIFSASKALHKTHTLQQKAIVSERREKIFSFLESSESDTHFLLKVPPIQGIIRSRANDGVDTEGSSTQAIWNQRLNTIFVALMSANLDYRSLSYLDETGRELVRVSQQGGRATIASEAQLGSQRDRFYWQAINQLPDNEVYVSSIENTSTDLSLYYAHVVLSDSGERKGWIVANISVNSVFAKLGVVDPKTERVTLFDETGKYVYDTASSPIQESEVSSQNTDLDREALGNIRDEYSAEFVERFFREEDVYGVRSQGDLIGFTTIDLGYGEGNDLFLLYRQPESIALRDIQGLKLVSIAVILVSAMLSITLALARLRSLQRLVRQLVGQLASACQQIVVTMTEQEAVTSHQSAAVNETATTMEELGATSRQSEQQATATVGTVQQALESSETGSRSIGETLAGMSEMRSRVQTIADRIQNLSAQATEIGQISRLVSEMARQTNMLSLNAAIEAVRAGESGRGFAVVADEIRKLADESEFSAAKIDEIVTSIQQGVDAAVSATDDGIETLEFSLMASQNAASAFSEVSDSICVVAIGSQDIARLQKQQVLAIQQTIEAIETIEQGIRETALGMSQTRSGTEQLNRTAQELEASF